MFCNWASSLGEQRNLFLCTINLNQENFDHVIEEVPWVNCVEILVGATLQLSSGLRRMDS